MARCGLKDDGTIQPAKITHFVQQGFTIKGVIHGGMNDGEEVYSYKDLGIQNIIGFEPLTFAASKARHDHGVQVYEIALANKDGKAELIVTKGDGKGSSIYKPILESEEVKKNWVDNGIIVGKQKIKTMRFATWVKKYKVDLSLYDCLVLDVQGMEMDALLGMDDYLQGFKYLSIELSTNPVYVGETPAQELADWLDSKGFLLDSPLYSHNDSFFVRKDIKSESDGIYRGLG
jgi:FkbM family methyltransferase